MIPELFWGLLSKRPACASPNPACAVTIYGIMGRAVCQRFFQRGQDSPIYYWNSKICVLKGAVRHKRDTVGLCPTPHQGVEHPGPAIADVAWREEKALFPLLLARD